MKRIYKLPYSGEFIGLTLVDDITHSEKYRISHGVIKLLKDGDWIEVQLDTSEMVYLVPYTNNEKLKSEYSNNYKDYVYKNEHDLDWKSCGMNPTWCESIQYKKIN